MRTPTFHHPPHAGRLGKLLPTLGLCAAIWCSLNLVADFQLRQLSIEQRRASDRQLTSLKTLLGLERSWNRVQTAIDAGDIGGRSTSELRRVRRRLDDQLQEAQQDVHGAIAGNQQNQHWLAWGRWLLLSQLIALPACAIWAGWRLSAGFCGALSRISLALEGISSSLASQVTRPPSSIACSRRQTLAALERQVRQIAETVPDVTAQLQAARSDVIRNARLAAIGELAAGLAHELRNPLTSINLLVHSLATKGSDEAVDRRKLQVVRDEIQRMDRIIRDLLDFARPTSAQRIRHDLRDVVDRALFFVQARAQQRGIKLSHHLPAEPAWVQADPDQLYQVFLNLLLNGIEAMDGGGQLTVSLDNAEPATSVGSGPATTGARDFRVRVSDTGRGIPPEILDRIFEPFVTSKEQGTGLGLAISRRIVEEHGGRLTASNRPQSGAMFTVELRS